MAFGTTPVKSIEYTLYSAEPARKVNSGKWHGRKRVAYGEYEASALAAGSQVAMVRVPKGAMITGGQLHWDALGASTAIWLGDDVDCDRLMVSSSAVASSRNVDCGRLDAIDGIGFTYTGDCDILLTLSYAAAATGTIKLVLEYVTE